jgi:hypothetical protein
MDSNLLFNISLTLNDIRDSLLSSGGVKPFIPGFFAVLGVVLGFVLNASKEALVENKNIEKYKECILIEIGIIKDECEDSLRAIFKMRDNNINTGLIGITHNYVSMSFICFDKYFPEIVKALTKEEFSTVSKLYSAAKSVDSATNNFISSLSTMKDVLAVN